MAKNKRQLKKSEKKATSNALKEIVGSGTVTEMMFTKIMTEYNEGMASDAQAKKQKNKDNIFKEFKIASESISATAQNFSEIKSILTSLVSIFSQALQNKSKLEYAKEEAFMEAVPVDKPKLDGSKKTSKESEESYGSLLKSFFTNPAVIAAFSGLVYLFLPKDIKEKIGAFFSGFVKGSDETSAELSTFEKALTGAAAGITTYLGAAALQKIGEALTTVVTLIAKAKASFGRIKGKKLSDVGKGALEFAKKNKAAVAGVAVGAGTFAALSMEGEKTPEEKKPPKEELKAEAAPPSPAPAPGPTPSPKPQAETKASLGQGIKPGAKLGLKVPEMTGEDKPVMKMIKDHEGVRFRPYKDSLGLWTVGVGHLIGDGKTLPPEWNREFTEQEVDILFAKDYKHHKEAAQKIPGYEGLNEKGKAGLIDLTFNMGPAWYKKFPLFEKNLKRGDVEGAAQELEKSKWYTQVGNRAPTVVGLIRAGGKGEGIKTEAPEGIKVAAVSPGAQKTGETLMASSELVEGGGRPGNVAVTNSINNSKRIAGKQSFDPPPPIPSPIANRGTLALGTRHSTSYT